MSHTPDQARRLHCPIKGMACVADQCAMWRWIPMSKSMPTAIKGPSGATVTTYQQVQVKEVGHCGLAYPVK